MRSHSSVPEAVGVWEATAKIVVNPWRVFVVDWNWKAALLSALFRGVMYAFATVPRGPGAIRGVWIELGFRFLVGGFWGSLLQAYRAARPAWLAGLCSVLLLPASAHSLEYLAPKAGGATHVGAGMFLSILVSAGSLLINWLLMRKGLLVTGAGTASLGDDLRRLPGVVVSVFRRQAGAEQP